MDIGIPSIAALEDGAMRVLRMNSPRLRCSNVPSKKTETSWISVSQIVHGTADLHYNKLTVHYLSAVYFASILIHAKTNVNTTYIIHVDFALTAP